MRQEFLFLPKSRALSWSAIGLCALFGSTSSDGNNEISYVCPRPEERASCSIIRLFTILLS